MYTIYIYIYTLHIYVVNDSLNSAIGILQYIDVPKTGNISELQAGVWY